MQTENSRDKAREPKSVRRNGMSRAMGTSRKQWTVVLASILAVTFLLLWTPAPVASNQPLEVWATHPWLAMTASFIGGAYCTVHPMQVWNEEGGLSRRGDPPGGAIVLAFDPSDLTLSRVSRDERVMLLYERDLGGLDEMNMPFLDPATLPFIGLRILSRFSEIDPGNYAYYQRRLAEFQARLDSTVLVGRQMLGSVKMLDLCWQVGRWMQAAAKDIIRPPAGVKEAWTGEREMETLFMAIEEAEKQGWLVLCDAWTPEHVLEAAQETGSCLLVPAPTEEHDFFLYLYDLYLLVWNRVRSPGIHEGLADSSMPSDG